MTSDDCVSHQAVGAELTDSSASGLISNWAWESGISGMACLNFRPNFPVLKVVLAGPSISEMSQFLGFLSHSSPELWWNQGHRLTLTETDNTQPGLILFSDPTSARLSLVFGNISVDKEIAGMWRLQSLWMEFDLLIMMKSRSALLKG